MTNEPTTIETTKHRRWPWLAGIVAALLLGAGIGGAAADEPSVRQVGQGVTPEPAVTVTAEPIVETVTETVEGTPGVCVVALEAADVILESAADLFGIVSDVTSEVADILDADGYMITAEWNDIDTRAYARMRPLESQFSDALDDYFAANLACTMLAE